MGEAGEGGGGPEPGFLGYKFIMALFFSHHLSCRIRMWWLVGKWRTGWRYTVLIFVLRSSYCYRARIDMIIICAR